MTSLQPHLHSSLSIVTCLGRWRLMAGRLSPFLPASDPRLPDARQGRVLSLHHLEGKFFTYMNTQLSRYNDLAAHPLYLAIQFRANGSHTKRAPDLWESARFTSIFLASGFFCSQAESSLCRACRRIPTPNASPVTDHLKIRICRVPFKYILITQARTIQNPLDGNHNPDNKRKTVYGSNTHTSG